MEYLFVGVHRQSNNEIGKCRKKKRQSNWTAYKFDDTLGTSEFSKDIRPLIWYWWQFIRKKMPKRILESGFKSNKVGKWKNIKLSGKFCPIIYCKMLWKLRWIKIFNHLSYIWWIWHNK